MSASLDGSESVDQFLARVASLSSKQGIEDAERSRRLEEEMLQARKERQARRAERARSISPSKTGPMPTLPSPLENRMTTSSSIEPPITLTPKPQTFSPFRSPPLEYSPQREAPKSHMTDVTSKALPLPPDDQKTSPTIPFSNSTSLSRSGTLSWQQRPSSRGSNSLRSRPMSGSSVAVREQNSFLPTNPSDSAEMSRKEIAQSLGAKDPTWFRQTEDRTLNSPALRKTESEGEKPSPRATQGMRLPGMSENASPQHKHQTSAWATQFTSEEPLIKTSPSVAEKSHISPEYNRPTSKILDYHIPDRVDQPSSSTLEKSESKGNTSDDLATTQLDRSSSILASTNRSPSPTKGLGGFVQSAMMKRSDSVSKRWSVQANAGLKRGDSIASNRPTSLMNGTQGFASSNRSPTRESRVFWDGNSSPLATSRPSSRLGLDEFSARSEPEQISTHVNLSEPPPSTKSSVVEPNLRQNSVSEMTSNVPSDDTLPRSPTKTLDPRRWSPTKSSWLESALSKPESPRMPLIKPEIPSWKRDLQRSKVEKEAVRDDDSEAVTKNNTELPNMPQPTPVKQPVADSSVLPRSDAHTNIKQSMPPDSSSSTEISKSPTNKPVVAAQILPASKSSTIRSEPTPRPTAVSKPDSGISKPLETEKLLEKKPPVLKPKPQTPSKTDLRASLKPRHNANTSTDEKEPEFLSMFGKLKRTQTQNYVAPDELKENITHGKAALNVTDGPRKTKRVDEFKESILQQKNSMNSGAGSIHKRMESSGRQNPPSVGSNPLPEALARQKTLHKSSASRDETTGPRPLHETSKPIFQSNKSNKPQPPDQKLIVASNNEKANPSTKQPVKILEDSETLQDPTSTVKPAEALPGPRVEPENKAQDLPQTLRKLENTPSVTSNQSQRRDLPEHSKLASRLNPALAGILSRGGSPKIAGETNSTVNSASPNATPTMITQPRKDEESHGSSLTHMTKGRAKGPKRRTPKADLVSEDVSPPETNAAGLKSTAEEELVRASSPTLQNNRFQTTREDNSPRKLTATDPLTPRKHMSVDRQTTNEVTPNSQGLDGDADSKTSAVVMKEKPTVAIKSPELRKVSKESPNPKTKDEVPFATETSGMKTGLPATVSEKFSSHARPLAMQNSPQHRNQLFESLADSKSVKPASATPPAQKFGINQTPTKTKSNGLGLELKAQEKKAPVIAELTPPPDEELRRPITGNKSTTSRPTNNNDTNARSILEGFFGRIPNPDDRADFDTQAFLAALVKNPLKIKSTNKQVWEINGDGKMITMPPHQEYILFEDSMYLCVHTFEATGQSKTCEVYLWCGDAVAEAAIEDAQLFCRKTARDNNAKLQVVKQGKEPSNFFQALGGIVIFRKTKSSALYMLCGRRHLGHIAFDEVEFSASSLCTGFSYIISARFGKLYLWKGRGSSADEVGCARLIGMDLGLTGEIEEVAQGNEPSTFWEAFSSTQTDTTSWSEHWSARDQHNGYPCKLFRAEHDRPKSSGSFWGLRSSSPPKSSNRGLVEEIVPFCQKDVDSHHLYILDAYSNVYLIVGNDTSTKFAEFATALQIAQEIAVLTPSLQDRSLLPSCQVVFGDVPQDLKASFRKWIPQRSNNDRIKSACIPAEEVFTVMGL